ncbi:MAG: hypothetical protein ABIF18_01520 [archaeon]
MEKVMVTFEENSKEDIIMALGLHSSEGEIVDSQGLVVTDQNYESVELKNFGGVLRGSKVFINNNSVELVKFFSSHLE